MGSDRHPLIVRAEGRETRTTQRFTHPLNPNSEMYGELLARMTGLKRTGVTWMRIPPGKESFIFHSHQLEEEWMFILSGRGVVEIDDTVNELGPGDFVGFPTPSAGHLLRNTGAEDLVYLSGGENREFDVADFPRHGKRLIKVSGEGQIVDHSALEKFP